MKSENPIEEVWRIRDEISAECGHDVGRLFKHLRKLEAQHKDRLVQPSPRRAKLEAPTTLREDPPLYGGKK